jgi:2-hydroxychromene-2-carboxylate isomerase
VADPRLTVVAPEATAPPPAAFYFDLGSPEAWLAAERVLETLPFAAEWVPVLASGLGPSAETWDAFRCEEERRARLQSIEDVAAARGLLAVRWPSPFPFDSALAMHAATYAKTIGRTVAFGLAAFRQAFAGGRVLDEDTVLLAGAASEMHPRATLVGAGTRATREALATATVLAVERGVRDVPAVWRDGRVWHGDAGLDRAAAALVAP